MEKLRLTMLVFFVCFLFVGPSSSALLEKCYGKYGCFNRFPHYVLSLQLLPQSPDEIGTKFMLFTRSNRESFQLLNDEDEDKLKNSNFDSSKRTIFIVHGFTESYSVQYAPRMVKALLDREDCNVIFVDWFNGATLPYAQASGNTRLVGAQIAVLIEFIISSYSADYPDNANRFYVIGFSLGGQIAGHAGRHLRENNMVLGRITGLDAAGPYFTLTDPAVHLDITDAKFVDTIHSSVVGYAQPHGHIDFYPNGGSVQPGCIINNIGDVWDTFACPHYRATEYYIASVQNECSWKARPCSSYTKFLFGLCKSCNGECPSLGYDADKTQKTGKHYLKTTTKAPFCSLS